MRSVGTFVFIKVLFISIITCCLLLMVGSICSLDVIHFIHNSFPHVHDLFGNSSLPGRVTGRHVGEILILLGRFLGVSSSLDVINLSIQECNLLLQSGYLSLRSVFIECLLSNELSSQILYLKSELLLDSLVLFSHDVPPDHIERIQNLWDTCLGELAFEFLLQLRYFLDGLCRNVLVCVTNSLCLSCLSFVQLDTESVTHGANWLVW